MGKGQDKLERLEKRLQDNKKISKRNKKIIIDFINDRDITDVRKVKYLLLLPRLALMLKKDFDKATIKDYKHVIFQKVNKLKKKNGEPVSDWHRADMRSTLKVLIKFTNGLNYNPLEWNWLKSSPKSNEKISRVEDNENLSAKEIQRMIDNARTLQHKTIVSILYDSVARPNEFLNLRIKDVSFETGVPACKIYVNTSKTFKRHVTIAGATFYYIKRYLEEHPFRNDGNAYLWVTKDGKPLSLPNLSKILKNIGKAAKIKKPISPYRFRHAKITTLRLDTNYTDDIVKKISGHSPNSKHFAVYTHITERDTNDAVLKAHGLIRAKQKTMLKEPVKCMDCGSMNPPTNKFCSNKNCNAELGVVSMVREELMKALKSLGTLDNIENETIARLKEKATEKKLLETIQKTTGF